MRALIAGILFLLLGVNMVGSVLSFRITREVVRRQSRRETERTQAGGLSRFVFTPSQFDACYDGDKEMVIAGEHFDIKQVTCQNGKVIVHARHDHHETKLVKEFVAWWKQKLTDDEPEQKRPQLKFTQLEFYLQKTDFFYCVPLTSIGFYSYDSPLSFISLSPHSPPPDFVTA